MKRKTPPPFRPCSCLAPEPVSVLVPVQPLVGPLVEPAEPAEPAEIIPALVTPPGVGPLADHEAEERAWQSARARTGSQPRDRRRG